MTLFDALRILAETHTRDDRQVGFVVEAGLPSPYVRRHSQEDYLAAWKVVREQLHMQVDPEE